MVQAPIFFGRSKTPSEFAVLGKPKPAKPADCANLADYANLAAIASSPPKESKAHTDKKRTNPQGYIRGATPYERFLWFVSLSFDKEMNILLN